MLLPETSFPIRIFSATLQADHTGGAGGAGEDSGPSDRALPEHPSRGHVIHPHSEKREAEASFILWECFGPHFKQVFRLNYGVHNISLYGGP